MDASFEVLVPRGSKFSNMKFEIPYFNWQGVDYPQGLPMCTFGDSFELKFDDNHSIDYGYRALPANMRKIEWELIAISGDGLDDYCGEIFGIAKEKANYTLRDLLQNLLAGIESWAFMYGPQFDGFDISMRGSIDTVMSELENSLRISRRGFMVFHY